MLQKVTSSLIESLSTAQLLPGGATSGQVLTYDSGTSMWVASAVPSNYIPKPSSASAHQVLTYNGDTSTWVASAAPGGFSNLTGDVTSVGSATTYNSVMPSTKGGAGTVNGILKANGAGVVTAAVAGTDYLAVGSGYGLGYGQTWQDLSTTRSKTVTYTNSTGKPIFVMVACYSTGSDNKPVFINGDMIFNPLIHSNSDFSYCFAVPDGATYRVGNTYAGTTTIMAWAELR